MYINQHKIEQVTGKPEYVASEQHGNE